MGRTAYDFETHGLKNIRTYIRNFELPRPDALSQKDWHFMHGRLGGLPYVPATDVNKSHQNHLEVRHEKWRFLENIKHLSFEAISPLKWTNTMLPISVDSNVAKFLDPRCTLPAVLPQMCTHAPIDIENMVPWLNLLLITATRILHLCLPRTASCRFLPGNNKAKDKHIFQYLVWNPEPGMNSGSVVVAYQPSFILTISDLDEFVSCKAFPTFDCITNALPSKYRLWAKIWDTCQATQCNWFVLTNYTHWVFGAFSRGMRVGFVSPVLTYNRKQPTILEYVLFWIYSAMNLPGGFRLPQVDEPVFAEFDVDMEPIVEIPRPPISESFWIGRDQSPEESAHVELDSQAYEEGSSVSCREIPENTQSNVTTRSIRAWLATCQNAQHRVLDEDDLLYHNLPEYELLENRIEEDNLLGEWMIPT